MVTATSQKRAFGYFRVSDVKQTGEQHSSLETQEMHFRQYCQSHDIAPVATFTDVATGRRDDRKEYSSMVEEAKRGCTDVILVQFLDRFGRNPREILQRYWELESFGVSVVATDEDITEELILLVKAGMAGAESRRISERVRANMSNAVSKGVHVGRPPYGLQPIRDVKGSKIEVRWELHPEEASIVREMRRLAVEENLGFKAVADRMTAMEFRAHGGRPFASYTVQKILTNPAIMGTLVFGRKPRKGNPQVELVKIPGFFPAILSIEEWQELQERFNIRRENPRGKVHSSEYLLSGIIRCGHCRGPMTGKVGAARKGKRYRNYYCSRAIRARGLCSVYNGHSAPKLEKVILGYLAQFSDPEKVRDYLAASEHTEIERREAELRDVEKRLADSDPQFLQHLDLLKRGLLNEQEFKRANEAARGKTKADEEKRIELKTWLNREHSIASRIEQVPGEIKTFTEAFQAMDVRQQKAKLQTILKAVYIYRDGRIELEFRE